MRADLIIEVSSLVENIVNEYFGKEIFVIGKRLETILLDKKKCFFVSFQHDKLFSIYYKDDYKYSIIYTSYDNNKAVIYKSHP